jgi:filamentous hemagglutinin family protein
LPRHVGVPVQLCLTLLLAAGLFAASLPVDAQLPTGGTVVGGSATITQSGTSQLTINQTSDRGVIDWRSFSIGQGNRVDFIQPGRGSVTLNRVTGPDPSIIAGQLNANGQIVLVNQAGVFFGGGAQVNVESLIASTANVANPQAFMAGGRIAFDQAGANPNARIVNDGTITVREGGLVALLGPSAANNGVINARLGRVTVGGYETFTVDLNGDGLVNFAVGNPVSQTPRDAAGKALALASNTGTINADGGVVAITASAARAVVDGVVNVEGRINARTVTNEGGVIVFGGGETTQVNIGGTIDVSGAGAAQKGGTVTVTAPTVNVKSTARINANGGAGGGTVLVGGGRQGQGPIANARNTTVARGALITADATYEGNGGNVIVWADNATVFGGTITARGGARGGDGGFVEVSGKVYLGFDGMVDLRATDGFRTGTLLLDPSDITISAAADSGIDVTGGTVTGTASTSNISVATLEALLTAADVIIDATGGPGSGGGTITVLDSFTSFFGNDLTLRALGNIAVNGAITLSFSTLSFVSAAGQLTQTAPITADTVTFAVGGVVALTNPGNDISLVSGTAGGAIAIVNSTTMGVTSGGLTAGPFSSVSLTTLGSDSDLYINGVVTGFGITLSPGGSLFGGIPPLSESPAVIIDYEPFINDTSIAFWAGGQPQLTGAPDTTAISVLSACQLVQSTTECGGVAFEHGAPLDDNDFMLVNLGNEELIRANSPRPQNEPQ